MSRVCCCSIYVFIFFACLRFVLCACWEPSIVFLSFLQFVYLLFSCTLDVCFSCVCMVNTMKFRTHCRCGRRLRRRLLFAACLFIFVVVFYFNLFFFFALIFPLFSVVAPCTRLKQNTPSEIIVTFIWFYLSVSSFFAFSSRFIRIWRVFFWRFEFSYIEERCITTNNNHISPEPMKQIIEIEMFVNLFGS